MRPESEDMRRLLVRQSYPYKTSGNQDCDIARKRPLEEHSRLISSDGIVYKFMVDGNVIVSIDAKAQILNVLVNVCHGKMDIFDIR